MTAKFIEIKCASCNGEGGHLMKFYTSSNTLDVAEYMKQDVWMKCPFCINGVQYLPEIVEIDEEEESEENEVEAEENVNYFGV